MMIERKIIITGCGNCPFNDYVCSTTYTDPHYKCTKFGFSLTYHEARDEEKTHPKCMLPINIKSIEIK